MPCRDAAWSRLLNGHNQFSLRGLIDLNDFSSFVVAALRTHAMLHTRLLTVRAHDSLWNAQRVMGPAFAAACFRVTSFWIRHNYSNYTLDFGFVILDS